MDLLINGRSDPTEYNRTSLVSLLEDIQRRKDKEGYFIFRVILDGDEIDISSSEQVKRELSNIKKIEIELATLATLIDKNIQNAQNYLDDFIPGIIKASELFRQGDEQTANQFFVSVIDGIDWLSEVQDSIIEAKNLDLESKLLANKSISQYKDQLLDVTSQLLEANKNKDWVLVADLLEYELVPYYETWRSLVTVMSETNTIS